MLPWSSCGRCHPCWEEWRTCASKKRHLLFFLWSQGAACHTEMLLEVSWREKLPSLIVTRAMIDPDLCSCSPCGAFSNYFMFDRIDIFPINAIAMCSFGNHSELIGTHPSQRVSSPWCPDSGRESRQYRWAVDGGEFQAPSALGIPAGGSSVLLAGVLHRLVLKWLLARAWMTVFNEEEHYL